MQEWTSKAFKLTIWLGKQAPVTVTFPKILLNDQFSTAPLILVNLLHIFLKR